MVDWCWYYYKHRLGGDPEAPWVGSPVWNFAVQPRGSITAMDGETGRILWHYDADAPVIAGLVPTKSGILFGGDVRGNLLALDARNGSVLHRIDAQGALNNGLISYAVDSTQYLAVAAGGTALNTAGVSGPLRVSVFGLHGSDTPKIVTLDRLAPKVPGIDASAAMYVAVWPCATGRLGKAGLIRLWFSTPTSSTRKR
jgi:outer membrane protein assembly factor BamB